MNLQIATEFTQATTSSQPNAFANSVIFDGNNDNQKKVINDIYIGDSVGIIYFSGILMILLLTISLLVQTIP